MCTCGSPGAQQTWQHAAWWAAPFGGSGCLWDLENSSKHKLTLTYLRKHRHGMEYGFMWLWPWVVWCLHSGRFLSSICHKPCHLVVPLELEFHFLHSRGLYVYAHTRTTTHCWLAGKLWGHTCGISSRRADCRQNPRRLRLLWVKVIRTNSMKHEHNHKKPTNHLHEGPLTCLLPDLIGCW